MKEKKHNLSKKDKILIVLYEMVQGSHVALKYEDVIVKLFKKYPENFHLKGYPEYPDTSNQSFYGLRKEGLIQVRNKFVTLTEKGITFAKWLLNTKSFSQQKESQKLTRDIINEIERARKTDAFRLFISNKKEQIVDTDFFSYLGTTVRAERTDFRARVKIMQDVANTIRNNTEYKIFIDLHDYLFEKFKDVIKIKLSIGYPRRKA